MYRSDIAATVLALTVALAYPPDTHARANDPGNAVEVLTTAVGKDISYRAESEQDLVAMSLRAVGKDIS